MCFCLYSRTFIVSPAIRPPPQNSSQIYAYACMVIPLQSNLVYAKSSWFIFCLVLELTYFSELV